MKEKNDRCDDVGLMNPILSGFYPDPSICRRGDDLYMVTSSFEYYPGVPVFHSRDMAHWHQIGHCLSRPEQLSLDSVPPSCGIYAPTIRYHKQKKLFYMVTTLVRDRVYRNNVNFYVTAKEPAGPWSDPVIIKGAEGIDPTLFFDGDQAYYLGNMRLKPEEPECKERWIWMQPIDLDTGRLSGEKQILLKDGAFRGAATPEGPHLYHIGEWYYLMIAEGGTFWNHAETIFRSRTLDGPWESNPRNPLITHRNMGRTASIDGTGHADLIQLQNGEWWAVLLGSRSCNGKGHVLGRETFAVPVVWEKDWPVFSPLTGHVERQYEMPKVPSCPWDKVPERDDFDEEALAFCWNTLRTPLTGMYTLVNKPGWLRLNALTAILADGGHPALLVQRRRHMRFIAETRMFFTADGGGEAGMVLLMNETHYISLLRRSDGIHAYLRNGDEGYSLGTLTLQEDIVLLRIEGNGLNVSCAAASESGMWRYVCKNVLADCLSVECAGGFTGNYIGLLACKGNSSEAVYADFDWFDYRQVRDST